MSANRRQTCVAIPQEVAASLDCERAGPGAFVFPDGVMMAHPTRDVVLSTLSAIESLEVLDALASPRGAGATHDPGAAASWWFWAAAHAAPEDPGAYGAQAAALQGGGPAAAGPAQRAASGRASWRARAGALVAFIGYLADMRIIGDGKPVDTAEGRHRLQKYAYIAQELGIEIGYRFDFIRNGAFSTDLIVDIYRRGGADAAGPLRPEARVSEAFAEIVGGRDTDWLQVATFAVRDRGAEGAREALLKTRRARRDYGGELISEVYGEVGAIMGRMERASR